MALNGRLESIPLSEVLRMLARSQKSGCLRVEAGGLEGKIYLTEGKLVYATTRREDDLRSDLLNAGFVDTEDWLLVERRERTISEVLSEDRTSADLRDFLAEQGTEVIFRLTRPGRGTFDFGDDVSPRYDAGELIDIEISLADAEHRAIQWAEIEEVIPGTKFGLKMSHSLPEGAREVTLTADTWKLLSAVSGQGSVAEVAHRTGESEFIVAKAMANLVRQELVVVTDEQADVRRGIDDAMASTDAVDDYKGAGTFSSDRDDLLYEDEIPESVDSFVDEEESDDVSSDDDLLQSVLSGVIGDVGQDDSDDVDDSVEIMSAEYDADDDVEGSLSERAARLSRRRGLGALAARSAKTNRTELNHP